MASCLRTLLAALLFGAMAWPAHAASTPAPVPDTFTEINDAVHMVALKGTAEVVARGNGWVVDISDNADASRVRFALKPIENALGIKVAVVHRPAEKVA